MSLDKSDISKQDKDLKKIKYYFRPRLFLPILSTITLIAPYFHLFTDIAEQRYDRLLMLTLFIGLCTTFSSVLWTLYVINLYRYKKEVGNYLKNPQTYEW